MHFNANATLLRFRHLARHLAWRLVGVAVLCSGVTAEAQTSYSVFQNRFPNAAPYKAVFSNDRKTVFILESENNPQGIVKTFTYPELAKISSFSLSKKPLTDASYDIEIDSSGTLYGIIDSREKRALVTLNNGKITENTEMMSSLYHLADLQLTLDGKLRLLAKNADGEPMMVWITPGNPSVEKLPLDTLTDRMKNELEKANGQCKLNPGKDTPGLGIDLDQLKDIRKAIESPSNNPNASCTPAQQPNLDSTAPRFWNSLKESFSASLIAQASVCGGEGSFRVNFDTKPLSEYLVSSKILERTPGSKNVGTFLIDLLVTQAWNIVGGPAEYLIHKAMGTPESEMQYKGGVRFMKEIRKRGWHAFRWEGISWKDSNFGTTINTLHGVPHYLAATYLRSRGYDPWVSALGGLISNFILHESLYECWEQPKSGHDFLMNSLAALAVLPGMGWEIEYNPLTQNPSSKFYFEDDNKRYYLAFENVTLPDRSAEEIADKPVRPWNLRLGFDITPENMNWMKIGPFVNFLTNSQKNDFAKSFAINNTMIGVSCQMKIP